MHRVMRRKNAIVQPPICRPLLAPPCSSSEHVWSVDLPVEPSCLRNNSWRSRQQARVAMRQMPRAILHLTALESLSCKRSYSLAHQIWCDLRTRSCAARHRREPHRCAPYSRTVAVNCRMPACSACCTRAPNTNSEVLPASTLRTRLLPHCGAPALYSATSCGPSGMDSSRRALPAAVPKGGP